MLLQRSWSYFSNRTCGKIQSGCSKAKELIDNDVIGDIVSASAKRVGPFPPRIKDVGVTIDLAIHDLDVMNYLFDEDVIQVYGTMNSILKNVNLKTMLKS